MKNCNSFPCLLICCFLSLSTVLLVAGANSKLHAQDGRSCVGITAWNLGNFRLTETYVDTDVPDGFDCSSLLVNRFTGGGLESIRFGGLRRVIGEGFDPDSLLDDFLDAEAAGTTITGDFTNFGAELSFTQFDAGLSVNRFENQGIWQFLDDSSVTGLLGEDSSQQFFNQNVFRKSGGTGISNVNIGFVDSGGQIDVQSGTISFNSDTAFTGTSFSGDGNILLGGQTTLSGVSLTSGFSNAGDTIIQSNIVAVGESSFRNLDGGSLDLNNNSQLRLLANGDATGVITNDLGGSLGKIGGSQSVVQWNVVNNGNIDVEEGNLTLAGGFAGNGTATISENSVLAFGGSRLTDDASLDVEGAIELGFSRDSEGRTLALDGAFDAQGGSQALNNTNVVNSGVGVLRTDIAAIGNATWRNAEGGSLDLNNNSQLRLLANGDATGVITNDLGGSLGKIGGSQSVVQWDVVNNGNIDVEEGNLILTGDVSGTGTTTVFSGSALQVNSRTFQQTTLQLFGVGGLDFNGERLEVENFIGDFNHDQGVFAPGASPAQSQILGDYTLSGSSILEIELAGVLGGEFDQLNISGDTALNGRLLSVVTLDGFEVTIGDTFDILTIDGERIGEFGGLEEGALVGNFGVDLFITYSSGDGNDISLFTVAVPEPSSAVTLLLGALLLARTRRRTN